MLELVSHAAPSGHQAIYTTKSRVSKFFWWPDLEEFITFSCRKYLHCNTARGSPKPRPLGVAVHAETPNEILHFKFLFAKNSSLDDRKGFSYMLVIKYDFSNFVELIPCSAPNHFVVVDSFMSWYSRFGIVRKQIWNSKKTDLE
jgi:hypothetical protein